MIDGFAKHPDAALRFTLRHCGVRNSTPYSSGFARLACERFAKPSHFHGVSALETFETVGNRIPEARIGDFSGRPAPAAQRIDGKWAQCHGKFGTAPCFFIKNRELSPFSMSSFSIERSEEVQGRKMSSARRDRDFHVSHLLRGRSL
ncbi:MAG: hypothetical protein AB1558_11350 [Thermodesulfobacteriota bacterium]